MCCWGRPGPRPRAPLHTRIAGCGAWWFRWSAKFCACDSSLPCLQCFRGVRTAARPRTCHMGRGLRANTRDKTRPVHALRRHFREKTRRPRPSSGPSVKKLAQRAIKRRIWSVLRALDELYRAHTHIRPSKANSFAHGTQPRGGFETNDTFAPTDGGQHETTIATARP